ncbi:hypothetical protein MICRO8M_70382 [Microbacterium sp. 8M]|nr:hypothetical protein MICRO8M_70382 [Microbacterium sp. 8M]
MARAQPRPADQDRPPAAALHGLAGARVPPELSPARVTGGRGTSTARHVAHPPPLDAVRRRV